MKNQVMVWIAAATLHEQGTAPFQRRELIAEALRLFPGANRSTIAGYVDTHTNTSSSLPYSFAYLERVGSATYRLSLSTDENTLQKSRVPDQHEVDPTFLALWQKWVAWQTEAVSTEADSAATVPVDAEDGGEIQHEPNVHNTLSTYREAMLEHLLMGELMRCLWPAPIEVCKPQVDAAGYDLILQCRGVLRHVQLKTSKTTAATSSVNVHLELWNRHGGCIIWTHFEPDTLELKEFWWLGGAEQPLPLVKDLQVTKHSKGNSNGNKLPRPFLRVIPKSRFKRLFSVSQLAEHLFGTPVSR